MRLGAYECHLAAGSKVQAAYGEKTIWERHRHRFEVNNDYVGALRKVGLIPVGTWPQGQLVEAVELAGHPWYVGVQYHPEFKSRPNRAHPLFREFVAAALKRQEDSEVVTAGQGALMAG